MSEDQRLSPDLLLQMQPNQMAGRDPRGRFAKGQSGNPAGRPRGIRNPRARQIARLRWNPQLGSVRYAIDCALDGHRLARQLCVAALIPPRRSRPIPFDLPPIRDAADVFPAFGAILEAAAAGEISLSEAAQLARRLHVMARTAGIWQ
jgi:Family of unknown function (DUF5681)